MHPKIAISALVAMALLQCAGSVMASDYERYEQAVQAYASGQYDEAYKLFLPLAESGDPDAQFHLGLMYDNGLGVKQDHTVAERWYNRACPLPEENSPQESAK